MTAAGGPGPRLAAFPASAAGHVLRASVVTSWALGWALVGLSAWLPDLATDRAFLSAVGGDWALLRFGTASGIARAVALMLGVIMVSTTWALLIFSRRPLPRGWLALLLAAILLVGLGPAVSSRDLYAYAEIGWLLNHGYDPYAIALHAVPRAPTHDLTWPWAGNLSPYPPISMRLMAWSDALAPESLYPAVLVQRLPSVLAIGLLIWAVSHRSEGVDSQGRLLGLLLNPAVLLLGVADAHHDVVAAILATVAVIVSWRKPSQVALAGAAALLGFAVMVRPQVALFGLLLVVGPSLLRGQRGAVAARALTTLVFVLLAIVAGSGGLDGFRWVSSAFTSPVLTTQSLTGAVSYLIGEARFLGSSLYTPIAWGFRAAWVMWLVFLAIRVDRGRLQSVDAVLGATAAIPLMLANAGYSWYWLPVLVLGFAVGRQPRHTILASLSLLLLFREAVWALFWAQGTVWHHVAAYTFHLGWLVLLVAAHFRSEDDCDARGEGGFRLLRL